MLRKLRITLACVFFLSITALFLDFTGTIHAWLGWTARIQLLPALMAMNLGVVALLVILTLLVGRVYCSVICPLGVMQDVVSWISGRRKKGKYRFSYSPARKWLRYGILSLFVASMIGGIGSVVALLAPYSSYGRIASGILAPLYQLGNNLLAYLAERAGSYAFYETEVWVRSLSTLIIAVVTLIAIATMAWRNGRTYCNTICPVGTLLGIISRRALLRITIDSEKCNKCGLCSRKCKAACIDGKEHQIDYSRCVACMDCIDTCKHHAISIGIVSRRKRGSDADTRVSDSQIDTARRMFLAATATTVASTAIKAQEKKVDGGLAAIVDKKIPERKTPIVPPGAQGRRHFSQHCTACQLCVSACPNGVLRPSARFDSLMQPEASYERGFCRTECTRCSEVCPTGAIRRITEAEKSAIQVGHAVWIKENCVPLTDGVECGNCARHCPTGAILMIPSDPGDDESPCIPAVNTERCIGCGACENLCPARPFSAIYVEGHDRHRII
ncbi:MAG: 4Fe-4S binding protein [Muribaculaceae bacterium]